MSDRVDQSARSGGSDPFGPILVGLAVAAGAFACASVLGARSERSAPPEPRARSAAGTARSLISLLWPPALLALTAQGLRVWNAPRSRERSRALGLWATAEALAASWMALGARKLGGPLTLATAAIATAGAFVWRARRVEAPAPGPAATAFGWLGMARVLADQAPAGSAERPTLH